METATATAPVNIPIASNTKLEEILKVYEAQKKNFQNIKNTSVADRLKKIKKLRQVVYDNREKIQKAIWDDFRKPALQVDFTEIVPIITEAKNFEANLYDWAADKEVDTPLPLFGTSGKVILEPKGNALFLTPWNYPFQIPIKNLISAVAAGCVSIIKPSEFTPHTSRIVKEVLAEVFPENEVAVVEGDHTVVQELLKLKFDHIHFTGSPLHGKSVMRAAADNLTSVTLELGGKSPAIIDNTADLKATAANFLFGKFVNSGQTCIAVDYVLVDETKKDAFVTALKEAITKGFGANPIESNDDCRIVNAKHFGRIKRLLDDAISKGAKVEAGGNSDASQNYISPTILTNVTTDMLLMEEEIFGPIVPIVSYKNIDEALRIINAKEKPLALYIYSKNNKNQQYIIKNTSAGATCINETLLHNAHSNLPFGGVNNSGIGKSHGHYGFKEFVNERAILKAWNPPSNLLLPPYKSFHQTLAKIMIKYL